MVPPGNWALISTPGMISTPSLLPRGHGLGQAVHGVVVGEGHGREAAFLGVSAPPPPADKSRPRRWNERAGR